MHIHPRCPQGDATFDQLFHKNARTPPEHGQSSPAKSTERTLKLCRRQIITLNLKQAKQECQTTQETLRFQTVPIVNSN
jgi:hypothetical protein